MQEQKRIVMKVVPSKNGGPPSSITFDADGFHGPECKTAIDAIKGSAKTVSSIQKPEFNEPGIEAQQQVTA